MTILTGSNSLLKILISAMSELTRYSNCNTVLPSTIKKIVEWIQTHPDHILDEQENFECESPSRIWCRFMMDPTFINEYQHADAETMSGFMIRDNQGCDFVFSHGPRASLRCDCEPFEQGGSYCSFHNHPIFSDEIREWIETRHEQINSEIPDSRLKHATSESDVKKSSGHVELPVSPLDMSKTSKEPPFIGFNNSPVRGQLKMASKENEILKIESKPEVKFCVKHVVQKKEFNLIVYHKNLRRYLETERKVILEDIGNEEYIAVGWLNDYASQEPLTPELKHWCAERGVTRFLYDNKIEVIGPIVSAPKVHELAVVEFRAGPQITWDPSFKVKPSGNLYRDVTNNLIIGSSDSSNSSFNVYGYLHNNVVLPLTEDLKKISKDIGLTVIYLVGHA